MVMTYENPCVCARVAYPPGGAPKLQIPVSLSRWVVLSLVALLPAHSGDAAPQEAQWRDAASFEIEHEGAKLHLWTRVDPPAMKPDYWEATTASGHAAANSAVSIDPIGISKGGQAHLYQAIPDVTRLADDRLYAAMRSFNDNIYCYDHHRIRASGDGPQCSPNLALVRKAAQAAGIPFVNAIQACASEGEGLRRPGADELRLLTSKSIGSLTFRASSVAATAVGITKTLDRSNAAAVWNCFWQNGTVTGNEYISGSGTNLNMTFTYNAASAVTHSSMTSRLKHAIKSVTDVTLTVEVYTGFSDIKHAFKTVTIGGSTTKNMQFILTPDNGDSYCIWVPVTLILDPSCSSDFNGNDTTEPDPTYPNLSQPSAACVKVTDSTAALTTANELAVHSNHETRVLHTSNKTFAVYPIGTNGEWNAPNSARFQMFEINASGVATSFYTGYMRYSSCKPNIMLGYDGMVYVFFACDASGSAQLDAYYFDPSLSTYTVNKVSSMRSYSGGVAAGGYGYTQPILDNTQMKVHMLFCGGAHGTGDFAWFTYNQRTKNWETNAQHISIGSRHCYVYAYANGKGGVNLIAERDILLSSLGLGGIVTGADYAWDELSLFNIPNLYASSYTKSTFAPADYTQTWRSLYPTIQNNSWGDTYLTSDGRLHILYQKVMHGTFHHDTRYREIWHAVYDTSVSGTPALLYNKPIRFVNEDNYYACRFAESSDGDLYILAMPANANARMEIWTSADESDYTFSFDSAYLFSNTTTTTRSLIVTGPRNGSIQNNVIDCMYPTGSGINTYRYCKVTLP